MFKLICALLRKKPEPEHEIMEIVSLSEPLVKPKKKPTVKKATTRVPLETHFVPAKKKAIKKAQKRLTKSAE